MEGEHKAEVRRRLGPRLYTEMESLKTRRHESAAIEHAFCRLLWSTDYGDRSRAFELAEKLVDEGRTVNDAVNSALGDDWAPGGWKGPIAGRIPELRVPALLVHGSGDPRPTWPVRDLAGRLPNSELVVVPGVGTTCGKKTRASLRRVPRQFLRVIL